MENGKNTNQEKANESKAFQKPIDPSNDNDFNEIPDDFDESKWDPDTLVEYSVDIKGNSKKALMKIEDQLDDKNFRKSGFSRMYKEWHCSIESRITLKKRDEIEAYLKKLCNENNCTLGYSVVYRIYE